MGLDVDSEIDFLFNLYFCLLGDVAFDVVTILYYIANFEIDAGFNIPDPSSNSIILFVVQRLVIHWLLNTAECELLQADVL